MDYFSKMKGTTKSPPAVGLSEIFWSWIGSFTGIIVVAYLNYAIVDKTDLVMIIGSFGASAVLIYGAVRSPLAQPRNLIGGHLISAVIGVTAYKLLPAHLMLAAPNCGSHFHSSYACHKNTSSSGRRYGFNCRHWQSKNPQSWIYVRAHPRRRRTHRNAYCRPVSK